MHRADEDEALQHKFEAAKSIAYMLQSDIVLASRMANLEDAFSAKSHVPPYHMDATTHSPPGYSMPTIRDEEPPAYTRTVSEDGSIAIQPRIWSIFSGLALADTRYMSLLPLPLTRSEIKGGDIYTSGLIESTTPLLSPSP